MKIKIILFIILFNFCQITFSQHKKIIYVDENYKTISFPKYQKKLKSKLFDIALVKTDTAFFKKLRYAEFYGQLNSKIKKQLFLILNKRLSIDTLKTIQIHFIDSVPNTNKLPNESSIEFLDSLNNPTGIFLTNREFKVKHKDYIFKKHRHVQSKKDYIKKIKTEQKKIRKNTELVHLYSLNKGFHEDELKTLKYFKDPNSLIRKLFSDKMKMFKAIIILPNGEFYVSRFSHGSFIKEKKLTKKSYYDKQKKKWLNKLKKVS